MEICESKPFKARSTRKRRGGHWKIWILPLLLAFLQFSGGQIEICGAQSQEAEGLSLRQAVDIALSRNPMVRATSYGQEVADAQYKEARAGWLPQLQFSETFAWSNNPVFVFGSLLEQSRFGQQNFNISSLNNPDPLANFRTQLTLRQSIFDQWQTGTRMAQAKIGQQQAGLQKENVEQQIRFEVIRAYYGVLVARAKKEVAQEAVKTAEASVKSTRDRFETGMVVQSDLLAGEVQLAEFRQQLIQAEGDITTAYAALNTVLGMPVDTPQKVSTELSDKNFELLGQEELIQLALTQRPDYRRAVSAVRYVQEGVKGAKAQYLPRLDFIADYGGSGQNLTSGSSDYSVGASLTFNIFDFARGARLSQVKATERMVSAEQEHLANQIRLEVVRARQQYISARERIEVASRAISQAVETLRIVQDRYQQGLTTITEVLRAETAVVRARLNIVAVRYEYYVGYANVLLTSGRLTDVQPFGS